MRSRNRQIVTGVAVTSEAPAGRGRLEAPGTNEQVQRFALRLFLASVAAAELMTDYLGLRLGLYDALAQSGPATAPDLAERAGIASRYAREWLEQQAVSGVLAVDDPAKAADERVYTLPDAHAEVLTCRESPSYIAEFATLPAVGIARMLPRLLSAYASGEGVPAEEYDADWQEGQAGFNRALFLRELPGWLPHAAPAVHERLRTRGGEIADVGCGSGWCAIGLALSYPSARVTGYDVDSAAIDRARQNAADAGVSGRVRYEVRDATEAAVSAAYDLVCVLDTLHEVARPIEVLASCRQLVKDDGCVLVMDAKVGDRFTVPGSDLERFHYASSVLHCLPAGMAEQPSAATGLVMRPATLREYALDAGFRDVEVVPTANRFHRLYRLVW